MLCSVDNLGGLLFLKGNGESGSGEKGVGGAVDVLYERSLTITKAGVDGKNLT